MSARKSVKSTATSAATPVATPVEVMPPPSKSMLVQILIWIHKPVRKIQRAFAARKAKKAATSGASTPSESPSRGIRWFQFVLKVAMVLVLFLIVCEWKGWKPIDKTVAWFRSQSSQNQENLTELEKHFVELAREVDVLKGIIVNHRVEIDKAQKSISLRQDDIDIGVESVIGEVRVALKTDSDEGKVVKELADQIAVQTSEINELKEKMSERKEPSTVAAVQTPTPIPIPTPTVLPPVRTSAPKEQIREQDKNGRGLWIGYMYDTGETSMRYSVKEFLLNQVAWDKIPGVEVQAIEGDKITVVHPPVTNFGKATHVQFVSKNQPMRVFKLEPRYKLGQNL